MQRIYGMVVLPNTDPSTKCTASFIVALAHAGLNERSRSRTLQKRPADRSTAARGSVRRAYLEPGKGKRGSMLSSASCGPAHLRGARGRLHLGNQPFFAASRFVSWDPRKICLFQTILFSFFPPWKPACPRRNRTRNATFRPGEFRGSYSSSEAARTRPVRRGSPSLRLLSSCRVHAPDLKFGYVMPAGACETLTRTVCARVSRACACACVSLPISARACVTSMCRRRRRKRACVACVQVRGSAPVALAGGLPSWMLGVSDGWPPGHPAERLSIKLLHEVSLSPSRSRRCPSQPRADHRRAAWVSGLGDAARPDECGLSSHPPHLPAGG